MLVNLLNICSEDELAEDDDEDYTSNFTGMTDEQQAELRAKHERKAQLRSKIKGVAKMAKYFHNIREESEAGTSTLPLFHPQFQPCIPNFTLILMVLVSS